MNTRAQIFFHSDLQLIGLLWIRLKENIGRKYDTNTTMVVLKQRLDEMLIHALPSNESIEGFIHKTTKLAQKLFYDHI